MSAPGGRAPVITDGVMPYHPLPDGLLAHDPRRLEKRFADNGTWESVKVTPASGTTACLGMLFAMYLDPGLRRVWLGALAQPLFAVINTVAMGLDTHSSRLCEPGPGGLFANLHAVGETPR